MGVVETLRALWARRLLVMLVVVLAVGAGAGLTFGTPQTTSGIAQSTALVDTPSSQIVDLGGLADVASIATLSARATLLTGLVTSSPLKDEIAANAGIPPSEVLALSAATQPATAAGASASPGPNSSPAPTAKTPYVLTASIPQLQTGEVPILMVDTQGPTPASAGRLANSAIRVLQRYLQSLATSDQVPASRRVIVRGLGAATSSSVTQGASKTVAVGAVVAILLLGSGLILGIPAARTAWRRAGELERLAADPSLDDELAAPALATRAPMTTPGAPMAAPGAPMMAPGAPVTAPGAPMMATGGGVGAMSAVPRLSELLSLNGAAEHEANGDSNGGGSRHGAPRDPALSVTPVADDAAGIRRTTHDSAPLARPHEIPGKPGSALTKGARRWSSRGSTQG
jgi:hypothetical protein